MKEITYSNDDNLVKQAIDILFKKLGPIETIRFLRLPLKTKIDSVKRHRQWQAKLDKDLFFADVFKSK